MIRLTYKRDRRKVIISQKWHCHWFELFDTQRFRRTPTKWTHSNRYASYWSCGFTWQRRNPPLASHRNQNRSTAAVVTFTSATITWIFWNYGSQLMSKNHSVKIINQDPNDAGQSTLDDEWNGTKESIKSAALQLATRMMNVKSERSWAMTVLTEGTRLNI